MKENTLKWLKLEVWLYHTFYEEQLHTGDTEKETIVSVKNNKWVDFFPDTKVFFSDTKVTIRSTIPIWMRTHYENTEHEMRTLKWEV